jgi:VanZ family protein
MSTNTKRFLVYRLPAIFWAILLFIFSSIPSNSIPRLVIQAKDLVLHFAVYTVFGVLLSHAVIEGPQRVSKGLALLVMAIGFSYGASDEFHQLFVPGRTCTFSDFLADCTGVLFGLFLYLVVLRKVFEKISREILS